jgi:hypothetical protein
VPLLEMIIDRASGGLPDSSKSLNSWLINIHLITHR